MKAMKPSIQAATAALLRQHTDNAYDDDELELLQEHFEVQELRAKSRTSSSRTGFYVEAR